MLVIVSKTKAEAKNRVSDEALKALSDIVLRLVHGADAAATEDKMRTIKMRHVATAFVALAAMEIPKGE